MKVTGVSVGVAVIALGCSSFDERRDEGISEEFPEGSLVVPVDDRPAITAETPPPPISGGTLLITRDGRTIVAADSDRDRVSIADLRARTLLHTIALGPGAEPGRVHQDGAGRVHVLSRGLGKVITLDIAEGVVLLERDACSMPRGIDDDPATDTLYVACASGEIVSLAGDGGQATTVATVEPGLRDAVVHDGVVTVSHFKSAKLLDVAPGASAASPLALAELRRMRDTLDAPVHDPLQPSAAWRMIADEATGSLLVLHQYASAGPVHLETDDERDDEAETSPEASGAAYGGVGSGCGSIVVSAVSEIEPDGTVLPGLPIGDAVLTVDAALSPDGKWLALAHAGARDPGAPLPHFEGEAPTSSALPPGNVTVIDRLLATTTPGATEIDAHACGGMATGRAPGQPVAIAFNPAMDAEAASYGTWFVVQSREPAQLAFFDTVFEDPTILPLGGQSVLDTGHEIFHRNAGAGIACASCHLEGGDDGHVWHFEPIGPRRTQALHVGLRGTEPFHWDGDMPDLDGLMSEVFVERMGGAEQSPERLGALASWLFNLDAPAPLVAADDPAAVRGRALFASDAVGCASCHAGDRFTSRDSQFVGTTEAGHILQVPSLVGIGHRAPFIHDGCAETLRDRFDPACGGGDAHGRTSGLTEAEVGDLIAYLESL